MIVTLIGYWTSANVLWYELGKKLRLHMQACLRFLDEKANSALSAATAKLLKTNVLCYGRGLGCFAQCPVFGMIQITARLVSINKCWTNARQQLHSV